MTDIARIIAYLALILTVAMVVVTLLTFRRPRSLRRLPLLIAIGLSLLMLPIYMFVSGARLNPALGLPTLALGFVLGLAWGFSTKLSGPRGRVVGRRSLLFLAGWAGAWALSQALNLLGSSLLASVGLLPLFFSTGAHVGSHTNLLARVLLYRPAPGPAAQPGSLHP